MTIIVHTYDSNVVTECVHAWVVSSTSVCLGDSQFSSTLNLLVLANLIAMT